MRIYLKEKIGNPELFTGRKKELTTYLTWIERIKREISMSQAILSRRKTGKTALLQRLYNITFDKNDGVIPFYYEIPEGKQWAGEFCQDFYLTFIYQYIAFKTRKPLYVDLSREKQKRFTTVAEVARKEGLEYLIDSLRGVEKLFEEDKLGLLWGASVIAMVALYPRTPRWLPWTSLLYPVYYLALSLWLSGRRNR